MSEKISRGILIGELFIIVLPLSVLLLFATIVQVPNAIEFFTWYNIVNSVFALIACGAVASGILISRVFLKHGSSGLQTIKRIWWAFSFAGVMLALAAIASRLLPPSPEYSPEAMFRADFELFVLGLPMFLPLSHLILERSRGRRKKISADSKPLSAA
jgi:hypothetical protein